MLPAGDMCRPQAADVEKPRTYIACNIPSSPSAILVMVIYMARVNCNCNSGAMS